MDLKEENVTKMEKVIGNNKTKPYYTRKGKTNLLHQTRYTYTGNFLSSAQQQQVMDIIGSLFGNKSLGC